MSDIGQVDDLPTDKLGRAMALRNGLLAMCEGPGGMSAPVYKLLRRELMMDAVLMPLLPRFVKSSHDTTAMWAFMKSYAPKWEPRREMVRTQMAPLIDYLEQAPGPADILISDTIASFDADGVKAAWTKHWRGAKPTPPER